MREIILGTAGHVDHGKTSLIRALTGIETDRLKEEKKRGITIELGFAFLDLPCGHRVGIVDVPGHEKFVRNMVAGAAGMDIVAFVIAADEGIMPQTKEHFDVCRLLGVRDGIIVLTKKDMVEEEWLEMVQEELREFFEGSFLEDAPIIPVSSTTGEGIEDVRNVLDKKIQTMSFQEEYGPFRLAVDRVFSMKGFGTVITGTSLSGRIAIGDEIRFYPGERTAKIRGIQVHGKEVDVVEAGHRTAINLQGVEKEEIQRGDVAATPGSLSPSTLIDADLHYLASAERELKNRAQVRVHVGTREIVGRVILLEKDILQPGEDAPVQIILQEPVAVWSGDHYVIRSYSPAMTIGGGRIHNSAPLKRKRSKESDRERNREIFKIYNQGSVEEKTLLFLEESGAGGLTADEIATRLSIFGKKLKKELQGPVSSGKVLVVSSEQQQMMAASVVDGITASITRILKDFHDANPLKSGLAKEELRSRIKPPIDAQLFQYLLGRLNKAKEIELEEAEVRLSGHTVTLQVDEQELQQELERKYHKAGLKPPNLKTVLADFEQYPEKQLRQVLDLLLQKGKIVKINEALFFHAEHLDALANNLADFIRKEGEIDAPRFKELTGLTRKFSIPLLEYFDKIKLTIRVGDKRVLRKE